jgi:hypothetical protein
MTALFIPLLASFRAATRCRHELAAEILALRHQLAVQQRTTPKRPRLRPIDPLLWMLLSSRGGRLCPAVFRARSSSISPFMAC